MSRIRHSFITIQENEYTTLQAYKAPIKGFRVTVKSDYSNFVKSTEESFSENKVEYWGIHIGIGSAIMAFFVGILLAIILKDATCLIVSIFGPLFVGGPIIGMTADMSETPGKAYKTVEEAFAKAIAYQEELTAEVKTSLEYNDYLKNLSEASNPKLLGIRG